MQSVSLNTMRTLRSLLLVSVFYCLKFFCHSKVFCTYLLLFLLLSALCALNVIHFRLWVQLRTSKKCWSRSERAEKSQIFQLYSVNSSDNLGQRMNRCWPQFSKSNVAALIVRKRKRRCVRGNVWHLILFFILLLSYSRIELLISLISLPHANSQINSSLNSPTILPTLDCKSTHFEPS